MQALIYIHLFLMALAVQSNAEPMSFIDDFTSQGDWRGPIYQYDNPESGEVQVEDGLLQVNRRTGTKWHMLSAQREYPITLQPDTWVHIRFRLGERLLGADPYFTLTAGKSLVFQGGINGEMHWQMFQNCVKKDFDDELFYGSGIIVGQDWGKRDDNRLALPEALAGKIVYTDWHIFSIGYTETDGICQVRLLVDGCEVTYRDLDMPAPQGVIDNSVRADVNIDKGLLKLDIGMFGDGDLYGDTSVNNGEGIRWLHAFADDTPAEPSATDPKMAVKGDAMLMVDWVSVTVGKIKK